MIFPALTRNERGFIIGDERNTGGAVETRAGRARRLAQEAQAQAQQFITPPNSPPQNIQPPQPQPVAQIHHQQFGLPQFFNINPPVFRTPESGYTTTETLSGFGRPYTEQEWRKKLCEGDDSLLQRKIDKIKEREDKKEKEKERQRRLDAEYTKAKKKQKEIRFEALEEAFPDTEAKSKNITINPRPKEDEAPAKKAPAKKAPAKKAPAKKAPAKEASTKKQIGDLLTKGLADTTKGDDGLTKGEMKELKLAKAFLGMGDRISKKQREDYEKIVKKLEKKKAPSPSVGLTEAEKKRLIQAKKQLENMDKMLNMGIMMDEDLRDEIEGIIRDLERKK